MLVVRAKATFSLCSSFSVFSSLLPDPFVAGYPTCAQHIFLDPDMVERPLPNGSNPQPPALASGPTIGQQPLGACHWDLFEKMPEKAQKAYMRAF
ncbi:hypothetical protein V1511DRAFT_509441 [Dipodascopsis uninucleata]